MRDQGADRTRAEAGQPEPPIEPVLRPTPPRVGLKQLIVVALVLPIVVAFCNAWISEAEGGEIVCSRGQNRCEIDHGWLIRRRERFRVDELRGAKVTWSHATEFYYSSRKVYSVRVITADGTRRVGGSGDDERQQLGVAARIDAFAKNPSAPSLDARVPADTLCYVLVGMLALFYGFMIVALLIGWIRTRRREAVD